MWQAVRFQQSLTAWLQPLTGCREPRLLRWLAAFTSKGIRIWRFWLAGLAATFWWQACWRLIYVSLGVTQCQTSLARVMAAT